MQKSYFLSENKTLSLALCAAISVTSFAYSSESWSDLARKNLKNDMDKQPLLTSEDVDNFEVFIAEQVASIRGNGDTNFQNGYPLVSETKLFVDRKTNISTETVQSNEQLQLQALLIQVTSALETTKRAYTSEYTRDIELLDMMLDFSIFIKDVRKLMGVNVPAEMRFGKQLSEEEQRTLYGERHFSYFSYYSRPSYETPLPLMFAYAGRIRGDLMDTMPDTVSDEAAFKKLLLENDVANRLRLKKGDVTNLFLSFKKWQKQYQVQKMVSYAKLQENRIAMENMIRQCIARSTELTASTFTPSSEPNSNQSTPETNEIRIMQNGLSAQQKTLDAAITANEEANATLAIIEPIYKWVTWLENLFTRHGARS